MSNIQINISDNGTTTLATAGKYCDRNVDVVVDVQGGGGDLPPEAFNITGNCDYLNYNGNWDWFFNLYGANITLKPTKTTSWFYQSGIVDFKPKIVIGATANGVTNIFMSMKNLKTISGVIEIQDGAEQYAYLSSLFNGCINLKEIPEAVETMFAVNTSSNAGNIFNGCASLRTVKQSILECLSNKTLLGGLFNQCYVLDYIIDCPVTTKTATYNMFSNAFSSCGRINKLTFATNNGVAKTAQMKIQTIDLSNRVGWIFTDSYIGENSGITSATKVTDDATYQALKDNPDWWTTNENYSRYNHDSAAETINSLPDTSAYLATAGGTNTIKFRGAAGSLTDGGAINTLTAEEIAVATAKGWTVTLV